MFGSLHLTVLVNERYRKTGDTTVVQKTRKRGLQVTDLKFLNEMMKLWLRTG